MELQSRSTIKRSSDPSFRWGFIALLSILVVSAFAQPPSEAWDSVISAIEGNAEFPSGAVVIGADDLGIVFNHTVGGWKQTDKYIVASASKWISSTAIWVAIEQGKISVTDKVHQWIPWWTSDSSDSRSEVTLGHLLSFTSGFSGDTCNGTVASLTVCVEAIYNGGLSYTPGAAYYYGGDHLQVAGLMTLYAVGETSWNTYFENSFLAPIGLSLSDASFFPNNCPLLAGTLRTSAVTYVKLLQAIYTNQNPLLNFTTRGLRETDWIEGATIEYSPSYAIAQNWHYSSSFWLVCPQVNFNATCKSLHQYASPGAFGYMPLIDRQNDFWILVSTYRTTQGAFGVSTLMIQDVLSTITRNVLALRAALNEPQDTSSSPPSLSPSSSPPSPSAPSSNAELSYLPRHPLSILLSSIIIIAISCFAF
jgi:CubicO group peptidase (beta-lactamase class C family)